MITLGIILILFSVSFIRQDLKRSISPFTGIVTLFTGLILFGIGMAT